MRKACKTEVTNKPLQILQHATARPIFNQMKITQVTQPFRSWLPVAAHTRFKALILTYIVHSGLGLNSSLCSTNEQRLVGPETRS